MEKSKLLFCGEGKWITRNFSEILVCHPEGWHKRVRIPGVTLVLSEGEHPRVLKMKLPKGRKLFAGNKQFARGFVVGLASFVALAGAIGLMM